MKKGFNWIIKWKIILGLQALQVADFSSNPIQELPSGFVLLKVILFSYF